MNNYKIVVFGGGAVGKSAITISFINCKFFEEYDPTIEDSYQRQVSIDNQVCYLDILDTAGQEEYSAMRDQYVSSGEAFLLVYAINSRDSFDEISAYKELILRAKDADQVPIVLCGNKCDLEKEREVTQQEGKDLAKSIGAEFFETSALDRINIEESFFQLVREVNKQRAIESKQNTKKKTKKCSIL
jgi:GTPase KRas